MKQPKKYNKKEKVSRSKNYIKIKAKLSRVHGNDLLHKISKALIDKNQVVFAEYINVQDMVKNHNLAKEVTMRRLTA